MPDFTNDDLLILLDTAISMSLVNPCLSNYPGIILFRDFLETHEHEFHSLTSSFKNLPTLLNNDPLKRYPAELFSQEISKWRLQIGK